MGYLGNQPTIGAYHVLDSITLSNGQSAYTMQLDGANFSPQSVNHMLVIINGVPQPTSAYSINAHTLTLSSPATTGDVLNEIRVFGDVLNIGTPSDATVTNTKTNFVSTSSGAGLSIKGDGTTDGTLQLNCSQNSHGVKIASPSHSSGQSYTIKLPTENIAADKIMKVASISGSGTTAIGQMSFVDEPEGGLVLLNSTTLSGESQVNFDSSLITSTYKIYEIYGRIFHSASNTNIRINLSTNNGTSFFASSVVRHSLYTRGSTTQYQGNESLTYIQLMNFLISQSTTVPVGFKITLFDPNGTAFKSFMVEINYYDGSRYAHGYVGGSITASAQINYLRFYTTSGNFASGFIKLYGRKS